MSRGNIMELIMMLAVFGIPFLLTFLNIGMFVTKESKVSFADFITLTFGGGLWGALALMDTTEKYWTEAVYSGSYHEVLSSKYSDIIGIVGCVSIVAFLILIFVKPRKFTPVISAFSI